MPLPSRIVLLAIAIASFLLPSRPNLRAAPEGWYDVARGEEVIEVFRDEFGVPHVYAETFEGVWFGQGYVTAEDRLWQLEKTRLDAAGRFAEVGIWRIARFLDREAAIRHDERARLLSLSAEQYRTKLKWIRPEVLAMLSGYAEGVNAAMEKAMREKRLPGPFGALGFEPEPWSAVDLLRIGEMAARRLGDGGWDALPAMGVRDDLMREYRRGRGWRMFNELFLLADPAAPPTEVAPSQRMPRGPADARSVGDNGLPGLWTNRRLVARTLRSIEEEIEVADALGLIADWGGAAWAVSSRKSASGRALFFASMGGGPVGAALAHEVHLNGPAYLEREGRLNARGATLPGLPGLMMGINPYAAWAVTSGRSDPSDYYIERVDPSLPTRYMFMGRWYDMIERREAIRVFNEEGEAEERETKLRYTVHGPVVGGPIGSQAISVRRSWRQDMGYVFAEPLLNLCRVASVNQLRRACGQFQSSHHVLYADRDGRIAYEWVGHYATYGRNHDPRLPSLGAGTNEWMGIVPAHHRPSALDPQSGYLLTWNNQPGRQWQGWWGRLFWGNEVLRAMGREGKIDAEQFAALERLGAESDFIAIELQPFVRRIENHREIRDREIAREAMRIMLDYDGVSRRGSIAQTLYSLFAFNLGVAIFADEFPINLPNLGRLDHEALMRRFGGLLMRILDGRAALRPQTDYLNGRELEDVMAEVLVRTVDRLIDERGEDLAQWGHPVGKPQLEIGIAGRVVNLHKYGSYVQIVEMGDPVAGRNAVQGGQDEAREAPHGADQARLYSEYDYKPMTLARPPR